jgi:hypothetical protein
VDSLEPISKAEHDARLARAVKVARQLGFVGEVQYRHAYSKSGGAMFCLAPAIEHDLLIIYAEAFVRDAAGDDFSFEAIIAHERGHQLLYRHERLRRNKPTEMSDVTEEVLSSLIGSLIVQDSRDSETLVLKALGELVEHGMEPAEASRRVEENLRLLERVL